jgi:hypothetical protein
VTRYVIRLLARAGETLLRQPCYVKTYDPNAGNDREGYGDVVTIDTLLEARLFDSRTAALDFYLQECGVAPLRPDGMPNRPLTAFHAVIEPVFTSTDAS